MSNEVLEFAEKINAVDLKGLLDQSEMSGLFKRRNYFFLSKKVFLIIKVSRNNIKPFFGIGKKFIGVFNELTENGLTYYFVGLVSNKSGWVLSKNEILGSISDGSLSYSQESEQFKINNYNLRDKYNFTSVEDFLEKIGMNISN